MLKRKVLERSLILIVMLAVLSFAFVGCSEPAATKQSAAESTAIGSSSNTSAAASSAQTQGEIIFGVTCPITGPSSLFGERTKQGVTMAVDEINEQGGVLGKKLVPIFEDDMGSVDVVVNSCNKLVSQNVVAVVGPQTSSNTMAVSDIFLKNKIPFLAGGSSPKLLTLNNPYWFRIRCSDSVVSKIAAKYATEEIKAKKVGMIYSSDAFGTASKDIIEAYLKSINIEFVAEGLNSGDKDMTGQILKMKNAGIDCLIMWCQDNEQVIVAKQSKQLNLNVPIIASAAFSNAATLDQMDQSVSDGVIVLADFVGNDSNKDPKVQDYSKRLKEKFGIEPENYTAYYHDAVIALADAIKRANSTDGDAIRKALLETKDLPGIMSVMYSNDKGELVHSIALAVIKNKRPVLIKVASE